MAFDVTVQSSTEEVKNFTDFLVFIKNYEWSLQFEGTIMKILDYENIERGAIDLSNYKGAWTLISLIHVLIVSNLEQRVSYPQRVNKDIRIIKGYFSSE